MGLPVTDYRYTDPGAPQLVNGTPSEWIAILKACLMNGYGTKAPLGWTLEFEDAGSQKVAFRNSLANGGSGGYFQFWSSTGANAANTTCLIQCAKDMSALDTFIKPVNYRGLYQNSTYRGWEIIGTSRGFYLILHRTNNMLMSDGTNTSSYQYFQVYFIGDIESFYANDQSMFTLVSGTTGGNTANSLGVSHNAKYAYFYDTDAGSGTVREYSTIDPFTGNNNSTIYTDNAELSGIQHILSPFLLTITYSTTDRDGVVSASSLISPMVRGKIPGMYSSQFMGYRNDSWPIDVSMNGVMHTLLRSNYAPHIWINMEQWYD
ncbi:hypothetical protein [Shewanella mangrovisoli]|uniref:hypothetical protein n=1 Tax=Shewanella mangrovisoli TaxID=2864211 RepID=UPI001C657984|nr:hypothetical protein [Shewanella mangrovisoli]QYK07564.1 hypothetical protein K0H60_12000 [Shewanella mangrovisoli]